MFLPARFFVAFMSATVTGNHPRIQRKPAGRKPKAINKVRPILDLLMSASKHCWPDLNLWLNNIDDPRFQPMCRYADAHIWWEIIMTFLTRGGSRNAFDTDRNTGFMPENIQRICGQKWDETRLGSERTVTCSENAVHHADRVSVSVVETILLMRAPPATQRSEVRGQRSGTGCFDTN